MESPRHFAPPKNTGLLNLIRAKREWHWKPSAVDLRRGFRGWHQCGYLPHFDAPGVTQFVTFQLNDSFPVIRSAELKQMLAGAGDPSKRKKLEDWLDRGHGRCWLNQREIARIVEKSLIECDGCNCRVHAWVVMPNHVHVVVDIWDMPLAKLIYAWKGKSARMANALLRRRGDFWQKDYYDTVIRDEAHLKKAIRYTENNPVRAYLTGSAREWPWSSARHRDEYERLPWQRNK